MGEGRTTGLPPQMGELRPVRGKRCWREGMGGIGTSFIASQVGHELTFEVEKSRIREEAAEVSPKLPLNRASRGRFGAPMLSTTMPRWYVATSTNKRRIQSTGCQSSELFTESMLSIAVVQRALQ